VRAWATAAAMVSFGFAAIAAAARFATANATSASFVLFTICQSPFYLLESLYHK
jgi:hypothetical protein